MKITVTIYSNRMEHVVAFPTKWIICPDCDGRAVTTRNIECGGGGFTASEWREALDDDPDFGDDYFFGRYDEPCPTCKGRSTIQEIDREAPLDWRLKIFLRALDAQERDRIEIDATHAAERRMGA